MSIAVVVFNGVRVDSMDTNANTGHWGGSGGAPAAEAPLAYQNSLAVNKKVTASILTGIDNDGAGANSMVTYPLFFVKVYVSDAFDVDATFGVSAGIGSANNAFYVYNLAGSGAKLPFYSKYPAQGGYILTAINPAIVAWRDSTTGAPNLASVDWYGVQCAMINGNAKSENLAFDAIDIGTGLTITAGDGASTEGKFTDFVEADQNAPSIRWGCVSGSGNNVNAWCLLKIGTSSITEFKDETSIVVFKDGYHSEGLTGVEVVLLHANTIVNIGCLLLGEGASNVGITDASDTRPDFTTVGANSIFNFYGTIDNFKKVQFTAAVNVDEADIECELLVQNSCDISNSIIRTNSLVSVACLQDPIFGTVSDLHDTEFYQAGLGHALEIDVAGTYNLKDIFFTGYGATGNDDAAIDVTASSGTVTINVNGGDTPTYKTAGATVIINNAVIVKITAVDAKTGIGVGGATIRLEAAAGGDLTEGAEILYDYADGSGILQDTGFNYTNDQPVTGYSRKGSTAPFYSEAPISGTITANGFEAKAFLILDQ